MLWFRRAWPLVSLVFGGLGGCSSEASAPESEAPNPDVSSLTAVEVTTVTTVQGSNGIFLSPRPRQERPPYVEEGAGPAAAPQPSVELDRARVDTALLFRGPSAVSFEVELRDQELQHFYPAVVGSRWPIALGDATPDAAQAVWSEWEGWRAYAGRSVERAPAATLDYERLGLKSPVVLTSDGNDEILVTNRGTDAIAKALLVYSHVGGIGINAVTDLGPGMRKVTTPGPKEGPPAFLLDKARGELEAFFAEAAGPELARAMAQAKSIPLLETPGLRLLYLMSEAQAPSVLALPRGFASPRRFVIAQAEVLLPTEEEHVVSLLRDGLEPAQVPSELGRFSRAKLELAGLNADVEVREHAALLLQTLSE